MQPSAFANNLCATILRSPLHPIISGAFMLISVTGRKTGNRYTTPVNYVRDGDTLTVLSLRQRTWWRNLLGGAPVTLRLKGRDAGATAEAITDEGAVAAALVDYCRMFPRRARAFGIRLDTDGQPSASDAAQAAQSRVIIRVQLRS